MRVERGLSHSLTPPDHLCTAQLSLGLACTQVDSGTRPHCRLKADVGFDVSSFAVEPSLPRSSRPTCKRSVLRVAVPEPGQVEV